MTFPMNNVSLFLVLILSSLVSFGSSTGETSKYSGFYSPTKTHAPYEWSYMRSQPPSFLARPMHSLYFLIYIYIEAIYMCVHIFSG